MQPRETELQFKFLLTRISLRIATPCRAQVRRQIALRLYRAIKTELKTIRELEIDGERAYKVPDSVTEEAYLGSVVRTARMSRKLTQLQLAQKVGISYRTLIRMEKGIHWPANRTLWLIEKELNLNVETLMQTWADRQCDIY